MFGRGTWKHTVWVWRTLYIVSGDTGYLVNSALKFLFLAVLRKLFMLAERRKLFFCFLFLPCLQIYMFFVFLYVLIFYWWWDVRWGWSSSTFCCKLHVLTRASAIIMLYGVRFTVFTLAGSRWHFISFGLEGTPYEINNSGDINNCHKFNLSFLHYLNISDTHYSNLNRFKDI